MGKYISGSLSCHFTFHNVYVDDGQDELDAIFLEGTDWDAELDDYKFDIEKVEYDENDEEDYEEDYESTERIDYLERYDLCIKCGKKIAFRGDNKMCMDCRDK